ncbi:MAG: choice-of-anchor X domain-containing protein [archaeon]|nr:hypothetical protein [Candidatus Micrarchaeota archaeon]
MVEKKGSRRCISFILLFFLIILIPLNAFAQTCNNNGTCDSGEDKCTCSSDCGECTGAVQGAACQIYSCATGLCRPTTVYYCCGNHICESGEDFANCSTDCPPKEIAIELVQPDLNKTFMRGDSLTISARVKADGTLARNANVKATTFVGSVKMYDDGNHSDKAANDGLYGVSFLVPETTAKADHLSEVYAEMAGVSSTKQFTLSVDPSLEMSLVLDRNEYELGDLIEMSGFLKKRGEPLSRKIELRAFFNGKEIFESETISDENGFYSYAEHTALNQLEGEWIIQARAEDASKNTGIAEEIASMKKETITYFLELIFVSPENNALFSRGEEIKIILDVFFEGKAVENATLKALFPNNETMFLREVSNGRYVLEYDIPIDFSLGKQRIFFNAIKDINEFTYSGSNSIEVTIDKAKVELELISPDKSVVVLGEILNFTVKATYGKEIPVSNATVEMKVNDEVLDVIETEAGVYNATFLIDEEFIGENKELTLSIDLNDSFENVKSRNVSFEVTGEPTIEYFFRTNPLIFLSLILLAVFFVILLVMIKKRVGNISALTKRREELNRLRMDLQEKYFNKGTIGTEEYYALLNKYTSELRDIDSTITAFKGKKKKEEKEVEKEELIADEKDLPPLFKVKKGKKEEEAEAGLFKIKKNKGEGNEE